MNKERFHNALAMALGYDRIVNDKRYNIIVNDKADNPRVRLLMMLMDVNCFFNG